MADYVFRRPTGLTGYRYQYKTGGGAVVLDMKGRELPEVFLNSNATLNLQEISIFGGAVGSPVPLTGTALVDTANDASPTATDAEVAAGLAALSAAYAPLTATVTALTPTTGTVDLDMATVDGKYLTHTLTGNPTFTSSNRAVGRTVTVKVIAGGSARTLAFPAWIFVGAVAPTTLASGKVGILTVTFFDTTDAAAVAAWSAQP